MSNRLYLAKAPLHRNRIIPNEGALNLETRSQHPIPNMGIPGPLLNSSAISLQLFLVNGHTWTTLLRQKSLGLQTLLEQRFLFAHCSRVEICTNAWNISRGTSNHTRWGNDDSRALDAARNSLNETTSISTYEFT